LTPSGNEFKQLDDDVTHNPSKHLIGVEVGQFAILHEVFSGLTQAPEAHFNGDS